MLIPPLSRCQRVLYPISAHIHPMPVGQLVPHERLDLCLQILPYPREPFIAVLPDASTPVSRARLAIPPTEGGASRRAVPAIQLSARIVRRVNVASKIMPYFTIILI
jgi:hypothetical protein